MLLCSPSPPPLGCRFRNGTADLKLCASRVPPPTHTTTHAPTTHTHPVHDQPTQSTLFIPKHPCIHIYSVQTHAFLGHLHSHPLTSPLIHSHPLTSPLIHSRHFGSFVQSSEQAMEDAQLKFNSIVLDERFALGDIPDPDPLALISSTVTVPFHQHTD